MRTMLTMAVGALILATALSLGNQAKRKPPVPAKKNVSFKTQIFPIIQRNCLPCHTEDQMNPSELYLDSYEGILKGGKHGRPLIPGKPDSSLILQKLSAKPPFGDPMPLKRKTLLGADTLDVLRQWIAQGAKNN